MTQEFAVMKAEPQQLAVSNQTAAGLVASASGALEAFERMGETLVRSGILGNIERPTVGTVVAMVCFEEGMGITRFVNTYDVIGGKIRRKAESAHAEFRRRGGRIKWLGDLKDGTKQAAEVTWEGTTYSFEYTIEDAHKAKITRKDSAWDNHPADMLRTKVIGKIIKALAPEIYGFSDEEEERPPQMTNAQAAEAMVNFGNRSAAQPVAPTAPAAPKPANVTEVRTPAPTASASPAARPAPAPTPTAPPRPATPVETLVELSEEQQQKLAAAIGEGNEVDAVLYLRKVGWLAAEQSIETLAWKYAGSIINNPAAFADRIAKFRAAQSGGAK